MKIISILFFLFLIGCKASQNNANKKFKEASNCVVAHRGAWKKNNLPQNSIASLRQAIKLNCAGSEFDIRMTADDSLIINHDPAFNGIEIEKNTYNDLIKYNLSNGEKLPTLREYILEGKNNNNATKLICEIKPSEISKARGQIIASKVAKLVKELHAEYLVNYISFDYDILKKLESINSKNNTQYLNGDKSPTQLKADGIDGEDYYYTVFEDNADWIESAKKNNITLNAWTVNDKTNMQWLVENKFNYITTNEPEYLFEQISNSNTSKGWHLNWSDEFSKKGLPDTAKWNYSVGGGGYGNNELQYYTNADSNNIKIENGLLKIIARKQRKENNEYTSAKIETKRKVDFTYGLFEISAKLPKGKGTWPAIWMLGTSIDNNTPWPLCGEIDIMEHVGYMPDSIFGTGHSDAYNHIKWTQKGKSIFIKNPYNEFHKYAIEWTPEYIDFMLDGIVYNHITNEHLTKKEWPFDDPFFLILNVAVGGNWGGKYGVDDTVFPASMEVDYVRYFKK